LRLGFQFESRGESIAGSEFAELPLIKKGIGIRSPNPKEQFRNVLRGTKGSLELTIFDFRYSTGGQGAGRKITVAAFKSKDNPLPAFEARPRGWLGMHIAGKNDSIRIDDDAAFSEDYFLIGKDHYAIRALFSREVCQVLMETGREWAVEGQDRALLVYLQQRQIAPEKLADFIEIAFRIAEAFLAAARYIPEGVVGGDL